MEISVLVTSELENMFLRKSLSVCRRGRPRATWRRTADGGPEVTAEGWKDMKRESGQDDYSKQNVLVRTGCYSMLLGGIKGRNSNLSV